MKVYKPITDLGYLALGSFVEICLVLIWATLFIVWLGTIATIVVRPWWHGAYVASFLFPVPYMAYWWIKRKKRHLIHRERWTTYFQTRNSLAIKSPDRPARFVRRTDCVAYIPRNDSIELRSGESVTFPSKLQGEVWNHSNGEKIVVGWWPELEEDIVVQSKVHKYPWGRFETLSAMLFSVSYVSAVWLTLTYNSLAAFPMVSWLWLLWIFLGRKLHPGYYSYRYLLPPAFDTNPLPRRNTT